MATGWKRWAERVLARKPFISAVARASGRRTLILAYHNIVPRGETVAGDTSLHIDQDAFGDQLDVLGELGEVESLSEACGNERERDGGADLSVVITFDDAYRGALSAGAEELEKRGMPATVFVPPGLLGSDGFWWDSLANPEERRLNDRFREICLSVGRGESLRAFELAQSIGLPQTSLPTHARPVSQEELLSDTLYAGITFGAHTQTHPSLKALTSRETIAEMRSSKDWLTSKTNRYVDWLAYPYGLYSPAVAEAASNIFRGAFLVNGGLAKRHGHWVSTPYLRPRLNVPRGLSLDGLAVRVAGLME